jgi:hypothetical protein
MKSPKQSKPVSRKVSDLAAQAAQSSSCGCPVACIGPCVFGKCIGVCV